MRCSIFKMDEVSGNGPVSLSGELPLLFPLPEDCLLDVWLLTWVVVVDWAEEVVVVNDGREDEATLLTLLLLRASD